MLALVACISLFAVGALCGYGFSPIVIEHSEEDFERLEDFQEMTTRNMDVLQALVESLEKNQSIQMKMLKVLKEFA